MYLSIAARVASFGGALAIGIAAAFVASGETVEPGTMNTSYTRSPGTVDVSYTLSPIPVTEAVPLRAEDLHGVWTGTWGFDRGSCTIEINRIDGEKFFGKLRHEGAVVAFEGSLDAGLRRIYIRETKVLDIGRFAEWSLGTNSGTFSADGLTITGTGTDRWGTYGWDASKD